MRMLDDVYSRLKSVKRGGVVFLACTCILVSSTLDGMSQRKTWSLRACIEHAREHNLQVEYVRVSLENTLVESSRAKAQQLPSLDFSSTCFSELSRYQEYPLSYKSMPLPRHGSHVPACVHHLVPRMRHGPYLSMCGQACNGVLSIPHLKLRQQSLRQYLNDDLKSRWILLLSLIHISEPTRRS